MLYRSRRHAFGIGHPLFLPFAKGLSPFKALHDCPVSDITVAFRAACHPRGTFDRLSHFEYNDPDLS